MYRLRTALFSDVNDLFAAQIALRRRCGPDVVSLVSHPHMQRVGIRIGIHRDRRDPHLATGTNNTTCDLSAISYEDLLKHASFHYRIALVALIVPDRDLGARRVLCGVMSLFLCEHFRRL